MNMAIYHLSSKIISRGSGRSSVASAAYRAGEKLYDERQERVMNYSKKEDVLHKEIFLPERAPKWMLDREKLWNYVEKIEKRKDAQLAREIQFALPRELSKEQNIELAKEFVREEFVAKGMVADLCVHGGKGGNGEEQPHAHVMLSLREVTEKGFGLKERSWNAKENLMLWRESWAEHANKYLAMNGIDKRIDHRSLEVQGIELEPQKKLGPENLSIHEQRVMEHNRIARDNGEKILEDPLIALKAITYHQSTFTHHELARFINRHTVDEEQFKVVYERVKGSDQVVFLGKDEAGRERYSTREMVELEQEMMRNVAILESRGVVVRNKEIEVEENKEKGVIGEAVKGDVSDGIILSDQQQEALEYVMGEGDIKCLVGYAGTGKSCLLAKARELWEKDGYRVHGVTLAGIAAENLENSSGIESRTFASKEYYWDKGEEKLGKKDILVVDEAGMLGSRQVARIIEEVKRGGAKVIPIGDPQQLQSIEAGAAFRAIVEKIGYSELTEVKRQIEPWQQEATKEFALRHTAEALRLYEENGCINYLTTHAEAKEALVNKWNKERLDSPEKSRIMLAHTRRDVAEMNEMARDCKKKNGEFGEDHKLEVSGGIRDFAVGDRIYFLQNNRDMGVKNGTLGTIEKIDGLSITVNVDSNKVEREEQRQVTFSLDRYNHISLGYAATIHKYQGGTVDRSYILASKYMDNHLAYVGMTRHREKAELFYSKEEFASKQELEQVLGRDRSKDVTVDYLGREDGLEDRGDLIKELGGSEPQRDGIERSYTRELRAVTALARQKEEGFYHKDELGLGIADSVSNKEDRSLKELAELRAFQERFERDNSRLAAEAHREIMGNYNYSDKNLNREKKELEAFQKAFEASRPKDAEIARQEITLHTLSPEQKRAENLVENYHKLEDRYNTLEDKGGSWSSIHEAKDKMDKCAHEICNDSHAMAYLRQNDRDLFKEMQRIKESELRRQMQRNLERSL